jgi:glycosyltransferase involved in cell wall biosynthesis
LAPVRVAHVVHSLAPGGAERRLVALLAGLDSERFTSLVVCVDDLGELAADVRALGIEPVLLGRTRKLDATVVARLVQLLRREQVSIVHGWLSLPSVLARLAAPVAGVPVRVAAEGGVRSTTSRWRLRAYGVLDRALSPLTDAYVANSNAVADALRERGVAARKIVVIPNGVAIPEALSAIARARLRRELGAPDGSALVGMTARLDPRFKDHRTFLAAVAALRREGRDVHAAIIGEGPARGQIEQLAAELGIEEAVTITGYRPDAATLVAVLDVSVLLSYSEGFSNVVLETMAAGTPLVATAIPPNREALVDGEEGVLVPVEDLEATVAAIGGLLDDPARAARLGGAARARAAARYSLSAQAEQTGALYDRLLGRRGD